MTYERECDGSIPCEVEIKCRAILSEVIVRPRDTIKAERYAVGYCREITAIRMTTRQNAPVGSSTS